MSESARYDITNDAQLEVINQRLDELAAERKVADERLDTLIHSSEEVTAEWRAWRAKVQDCLDDHAALIADRLRHPLMDPATVEEMRRRQAEIERHLSAQDAALLVAADKVRAEMETRLAPVEGLVHNLREAVRLLRWVLIAFAGGGLYEIGKIVADRWLR